MSIAEHLVGSIVLLATVSSLAWGAHHVRRAVLPGWAGPPGWLADTVITVVGLTVTAQLLGSVGLLSRWALVAAAVVVGVAAGAIARPQVGHGGTPLPAPPADRRVLVISLAVTAITVGPWISWTVHALATGIENADSVTYHLPFAARFAQEGWTTHLHHVTPQATMTFYPASSELLHAVGIVAFTRDIASPVLNLGGLGLLLLAGWCVGRPFGRAPLTLAAVAALATVPVLTASQPGTAMNDVVVTAFLVAALALALQRPGAPVAYALAGAAVGLALGTKLSAAPLAGAFLFALPLIAAERGGRLRAFGLTAASAVVAGGFFYLRNWFVTGSPLPVLELGVGPLELPHVAIPLVDRYGYTVADYATDGQVWRDHFLPGLTEAFGPLWPLLMTMAAFGAVAALARGGALRAAGVATVVGAVGYAFTPTTAFGLPGQPVLFPHNLRYLVPALGFGLVLLGTARWLQRSWAQLAVLGALAAVPVAAAVDEGRWSTWAPGRAAEAVAATLIVVAAGAVLTVLARRLGTLRRWVAAAVLIAVLVALAHPAQRRYLRQRYQGSGLPAAAWVRDVRDARIAITGFVDQYHLYGRDLSNTVEPLGLEGDHHALLPVDDCPTFQRALDGFDFLVASVDLSAPSRANPSSWVRERPGAEPVWRGGNGRKKVTVFRLDSSAPSGSPGELCADA